LLMNDTSKHAIGITGKEAQQARAVQFCPMPIPCRRPSRSGWASCWRRPTSVLVLA